MFQCSYFGDPVYTYSLNQGIEDGFFGTVSSCSVVMEDSGWQPTLDSKIKHGREIKYRVYKQRIWTKHWCWKSITELVAKKITEFLKTPFCQDDCVL